MNRALPAFPAACVAAFLLTACAAQPANDAGDNAVAVEVVGAAGVRGEAAKLPSNELTENILYEFLLAEIAGQRGDAGMSAQTYTDLARRTRDPRIARRATE